jgi:hypothetical protein
VTAAGHDPVGGIASADREGRVYACHRHPRARPCKSHTFWIGQRIQAFAAGYLARFGVERLLSRPLPSAGSPVGREGHWRPSASGSRSGKQGFQHRETGEGHRAHRDKNNDASRRRSTTRRAKRPNAFFALCAPWSSLFSSVLKTLTFRASNPAREAVCISRGSTRGSLSARTAPVRADFRLPGIENDARLGPEHHGGAAIRADALTRLTPRSTTTR